MVPSRDIRLAQTLLSKLGYDPGPIDGVLGRRTRGAIQAFQRDIGVPITGVADDTLLAQLESATQLRKRLDKPRVRIARPSPKTYNSIRGTSKVLPRMPSRVTHQALDGTDLFRKVQSSIFVVIAGSSVRDFREGRELSQGSAVAVSTRHLLTNCHLLENRPYIVVIQGEKVVPAELVGRNECCDRCVLMVEKSFLTPVKGIRKFDDLVVGEKVYTVGAPIGLERTLGEGIISGLRKFEGEKLIQTSAPISSGSSGGGLFDTRGNLIGITTFLLDEAQSLNFAIAAE
ncbi:MAG: hypothetical protein GTO24_10955, partial [candidate division Zixibacteria bacterium]|nr:hypothetical protein [candidate division Zixibacteria bacterium]